MDFSAWGWPQFVMAGMLLVGMGHNLARHGEQKTDTVDFTDVVIGPAIMISLLYFGGFWK